MMSMDSLPVCILLLPKKFVNPGVFDFEGSIWYRSDNILGEDSYVTTAYFVDPSIICDGGRDQATFDVDGTGDRLWFQNGPTMGDIHEAPLTTDDADDGGVWYKHFCFINMGRHYFQLNHDENQSCDGLVPIQLMYSGGVMNGFVWQHPAGVQGDRWEKVTDWALEHIVETPPNCLFDFVDGDGVMTMHVYLRNWKTLCISD